MGFNNNVVRNYQTAEYGKFVEIVDNTLFPPISVVRWSYPDTSSAFPSNSGLMPLSSIEIFPKYAVLTKSIEAPEIFSQISTIMNLLCTILGKEIVADQAQLINFSVTTSSGSILVEWGDGTSDTINSSSSINHTYFCPNTSAPLGFWNDIQPCIA
jgi:hypothetical protein